MARPLRIQFEGALYYLVVRANNRQPLFRDQKDKRHYLELLSRYQGQFGFKVYCYLLISRQVHLLLETPNGNVGKIMQCLGTSYTSYFNRRHKRRGPLFEGRYNSFLIDKESSFPQITRYIHRCYFQSGSHTRKRRDYPWSSYRIYLGRNASDLVETKTVLSRFGLGSREQRRHYQQFVESGGFREKFHPVTLDSQPINLSGFAGNNDFQSRISRDKNMNEAALGVAERIFREVSLSLSPNEISDLRERKRRALTRHVAMYLMRKQTSLPLRSIGELLGVKAPAVALGIGKIERLLKRQDFSKKVKSLMANNSFSFLRGGEGGFVPQEAVSDGSASA